MITEPLVIERSQIPVTKILNRGRKKGVGVNTKVLFSLKPGESVWEVPPKKMLCFRIAAFRNKIKIRTRKQPNGKYAIWRI